MSLSILDTPTPTPTFTPTPTPRPPQEFLVCSAPGAGIPDNATAGLRSDITLDLWGKLSGLEVYVRISHPYSGDLSAEINQRSTGSHTVLFDRPGPSGASPVKNLKPDAPEGSIRCDKPNIQAIFSQSGSQSVANKCQTDSMVNVAIGGIFRPSGDLSQFIGSPASGVYSLLINDSGAGDSGTLDKWCLHGTVADTLPDEPLAPMPTQLPDSALVPGMSGQNQALPLDCESRSAVDWARHFGVYIDELTFFNGLPTSDDPDKGFVGSVYGGWGNIPPGAYGVHAGPIAALLRAYGLQAEGGRGYTFDDLRAEIAAGHPAEVWVTGHTYPGAPEFFQPASSKAIMPVARFEHTVIAYGYTPTTVTILDGGSSYQVPIERFLDAWASLGNMAVMRK